MLAKRYDGHDHFYLAALNIACGTDPKRRDAILADFDKHFPEWNDKVADLVWELRPESSLPRLGKLLADPKLTAAQKGGIVDILAVYDNADAGKTMLALLHRESAGGDQDPGHREPANLPADQMEEPAKGRRDSRDDGQAAQEQRDATRRPALSRPPRRIASIRSDLEAIATDTKANRETRIEAVRVIGKIHHVKYFHVLGRNDRPTRWSARRPSWRCGDFVGGRGVNSGGKQALELLQRLITSNMTTDDLRQAALNALVGTRQGTGCFCK